MSKSTLEGFRLSPQQRRVWSLWQAGLRSLPRSGCALLLQGTLEPDALRQAAERLVATHEILRTTFHRPAGMRFPFQVVTEAGTACWQEVDLSGAAARDPLAAADELARQEYARPFDLERGPLFRLRLAALSSSSHVLLLHLPSLCADRRTLQNIALQLANLYGGGADGGVTEAPIQYADYSQWQNDLLEASDETAEVARAYWGQRSAATGFPTIPFEARGEGSGSSLTSELVLRSGRLRMVDAFCRDEGVSVADFLLACWQALLWRITGEDEVLVRDIHGGRKSGELDDALGPFATALPLLARFEKNLRFCETVRETAEARRRNDEWQPRFAQDDDFGPPSGTGIRPPGFEFSERPQLPAPGQVAFSILQESSCIDDFPVWLWCVKDADRVHLSFGADGTRFTGDTVERVAACWEPLAAAAAEDPRALVGELPILAAGERRRLLVDLNRTQAELPRSRCVHELFEECVERTPSAPALVFGEERLTYEDLNARANALAWLLRARGVGPGARVGLSLERSAEMIVAMLAILKAGGAYVPINPEHPEARLSLQLAQSSSHLVITRLAWLDKFAEFPGEKICLDRDRHFFEGRQRRNPERLAGPADLAYVIHTSGSTGGPKGVAIRHESLVNYAQFVARHLLGIDPTAGPALAFATVSTMSADLGNTSIFPSLISGGCLHVVVNETAMDGALFADYVARNPVDVLKIVPSHLAALLSSGGGRSVLPRRSLILGGEVLTWELVERIRGLGGSCEIVNHYGPTEATIGSLIFRVDPGKGRGSSMTVPIGRPIANTDVFILDAAGEPLPVGVPGELYIGGVGLAEGYCSQPAETAERFVSHPFSDSRDARLYRTGDRVRYLPDGNVEFLGRVDDQAKIRGFRIEPREVQAILAAHPSVREGVVVTREDIPGEQRLVAYVIPAPGAVASSGELRSWVKTRLPDYMVPSAFVTMKAFPLTPNGKLDRRALPAPEREPSERPHVALRTPAERTVAGIWQEVLRVESVGAEDNFFDLGGHSLLATQVVSRMRTAFQRDLPIRWLFESPTVEQLAARVETAEREEIVRILDELESLPENGADRREIGPGGRGKSRRQRTGAVQ